MHSQSRTLNPASLITRSVGVSSDAKARYGRGMRYLGLGLASVTLGLVAAMSAATQSADRMDMVIPSSEQAPHWTAAHAQQFPGCVATGNFVPARIVVVAREGAARTMPYTDATIAHIDATWATDDAWDDLYTIGRCAK